MRVKHFREKIVGVDEIEDICRKIRNEDFSIVTTNGCFDILHLGHVEFLQSASDYGDILIVGINSDSSVRRIKGEGRPVNNEVSRSSVISSLGFIDYCVIFSEDTPIQLIRKIKPHIHIKGGDYLGRELPEKKVVEENGGVVKILPQVDGFSSTSILKRITK